MFEDAVSDKTLSLIGSIGDGVKGFYLAGGTGLALQLGHRVSEDLDFFSEEAFDVEIIKALIGPDKIVSVRLLTLHCLKEGIRLSFLFYDVPLHYPVHLWQGIRVAAWQDIVAEKMKTISQRGAKKDFWDIYSVIVSISSIEEIGYLFLKRFKHTGINSYHVLKSLVYFEDAEKEPDPVVLPDGKNPKWKTIKMFFEKNIKEFEKVLIP